jgi:pimeloyl-ACP methyl ester carboxylesterase
MKIQWVLVACLSLTLPTVGCRKREDAPTISTSASTLPGLAVPVPSAPVRAELQSPLSASAVSPPLPPATVERIEVPGDLPAFVVRSASGAPPRAFFLAGICSNAYAYLLGFPEAARSAGGVVSIDGDLPCPGAPGFRSLSGDPEKQHKRIESALAAAGTHTIPAGGLTVVGSSLGASILQALAAKYPERYPRVAIIASPKDPIANKFASTRAVVTMSCSRDVPFRMKAAAKQIQAIGVPATYVEMPGCTHGNLADAEVKFAQVFRWLEQHGSPDPASPDAHP